MKIFSKFPSLMLIAAILMATLPASAGAEKDHSSASPARRLAGLGERPAGCHAHGGANSYVPPTDSSPPAPVPHQCCLTGHDVAMVPAPASHYSQSYSQWAQVTPQITPTLSESLFGRLEVSMVLSAHPPGTPPLRI